ncbi:hypothetical protein [Pseudarthrobacter albicanus]|uniref:hypothetical protein n=1 Tax=Pseudarthrobacter albicanus TaxID=2823873 RepID=UPI001BA7F386|nr:hypothetical protein [Pseudarthrobacter albicanus]
MTITNDPDDGNFDVTVTYANVEKSDGFDPAITAATRTITMGFEGQTALLPPEYYTARDSCSKGWSDLTQKGLQQVIDLLPLLHRGDPPPMNEKMAAIFEHRYTGLAETIAHYGKQIGQSGQR